MYRHLGRNKTKKKKLNLANRLDSYSEKDRKRIEILAKEKFVFSLSVYCGYAKVNSDDNTRNYFSFLI